MRFRGEVSGNSTSTLTDARGGDASSLVLGGLFEGLEIAGFAAGHKRFGRTFQFFPASPDLDGLGGVDAIVGSGAGDDRQKIGELLHHSVGGRHQVFRVRMMSRGIANEEPAGPLAQPMDQAQVPGAL